MIDEFYTRMDELSMIILKKGAKLTSPAPFYKTTLFF